MSQPSTSKFSSLARLLILSVVVVIPSLSRATAATPNLTFACKEDNDLYRIVSKKHPGLKRFDLPAKAVAAAPAGSGVLILASGYPGKTTALDAELFAAAAKKKLRLYVEYPGFLPGVKIGNPVNAVAERAVITSDAFGKHLKKLAIVSVNGMRFLPVKLGKTHIVAARVAGFDHAVFGLPPHTSPLLGELPDQQVMVGTTSLSGFITGRYAPQDAWREIWSTILAWLDPKANMAPLTWTPVVHVSYGRDEAMPADHERKAIERGIDWYRKANMIVHPSFEKLVEHDVRSRKIPQDSPMGDGKLGSLEAVLSTLHEDGTQTLSTVRRGDCIAETAMAMGLSSRLLGNKQSGKIARNLLDYYHFTSSARKRERGDVNDGNFGLSAWGITTDAWWNANYGDDNARLILGTLAVAAVQKEDRWDEAMMQCLLGNLRTSGKYGFRGDNLPVNVLSDRGWYSYFTDSPISYAPHFECYLWACYLWAYDKTGDKLFLDRAKTGIYMTMKQYTDGWRWTNGLSQERARIILPLAWLVRVENTSKHRAMLHKAVDGLLSLQVECGAIREEIGKLSNGLFPPSQSNAAYGTTEASLIARNGDPVSDLLYTVNFAFLGLHEAAVATRDAKIIKAANKLADFLCRIQVRSEDVPMVDGGWFRAFDDQRWEHWGSNADLGWGAWSIESGWTQGWITSVLALRQMKTSLWDLTSDSKIKRHHKRWRKIMLTPPAPPAPLLHDAAEKPVSYQNAPDKHYPDNANDLTNTRLGGRDYKHSDWVGWRGEDAVATIDLGKRLRIRQLAANSLRSVDAGILLPLQVTFSVSNDGKTFHQAAVIKRPDDASKSRRAAHRYEASGLRLKARYVRVHAKNIGTVPAGAHAAGSKAWVFLDELIVNAKEPAKKR